MKCNELQQRLDDYLDGDLDNILVAMLEKHVESCDKCASELDYAKLVKSQFTQLAATQRTPDPAFIATAFGKVRAAYPHQSASRQFKQSVALKTGFVGAIAAGFALWAVVTSFILPSIDNGINQQEYATNTSKLNLIINEVKVLRLAIDTPDELDKVTLSVFLPNHVELKGHKNKREISWDTKLAKGNNILRIPLKAIKAGQGSFIARLSHKGKVKTFKLFLQSDKPIQKKVTPEKPDLSRFNIIELHV